METREGIGPSKVDLQTTRLAREPRQIFCSTGVVVIMDETAARVARRFKAFKYEKKEKKETKVDRLMRLIREKTGLSRGVGGDIADALVRGREVERLAMQKGWPIEDGVILGPDGEMTLDEVRAAI